MIRYMDSSRDPTMDPLSHHGRPSSPSNNPDYSSQLSTEPQGYGTGDEPLLQQHTRQPEQCELGLQEHFPNIQLKEAEELPLENKVCTVYRICAGCSILAHVACAVCLFIIISVAPSCSGSFLYGLCICIAVWVGIILCVMYLVLIIEGFCSKVNKSLRNAMPVSAFQRKHKELRLTVPTINLRTEGYHYWRSSEDITDETFPFSRCIDVSSTMEEFQPGTVYRVECKKKLGLLNPLTETQYQEMKRDKAICDKNKKYKDKERFVLPNFTKHLTVYTDGDWRACFISPTLHGGLILFLCSWPYRILFWFFTKEKKCTYTKIISV